MPSQINNPGNVGYAEGLTVSANYLKAAPSTQFGTRQLSVLNIAQANVFVNYADSDSLFSKTVRSLQQTAEVWAVFTPVDASTDSFNVIISTDSQWNGVGTGTGAVLPGDASYDALEAALLAGSGVACTVTVVAGFVAPFHG